MTRTRSLLWPLVVALLALGATAWLWLHERDVQARELQRQFDFAVRQTAARVGERLAAYEQMLRGTRGLYDASESVTESDFSRFVDALLTGADVAGVRALVWVPLRGSAAPVALVAPSTDKAWPAVGRDLLADPAVTSALLAARESGGVALSERVRDVEGEHAAFLMCAAVYRVDGHRDTIDHRRAHALGWVCAAFRVEDLMSSLHGEHTPGLIIRLHDGTEVNAGSLMYGPSIVHGAPPPRLAAREYLGIGGRSWTLALTASPAFVSRHESDARTVVAIIGIVMSVALALLTWQLVTARNRALAAARHMTRALRDSAERYRRIVDTADEGIWTIDAEGLTSFANPKLLQMLGLDEPLVVGRPWTDGMDHDGRRAARGEILDALRRGEHVRREMSFRRGDGALLWALVSMSPIVDERRAFAGSLAMVTDVTERRLAEARRAQLEEQLRQSQKMEAVGTLAGGIAHDFNNLLAAILGNVALIEQELGAGHAAASRLAQIRLAGTRGRSLVQQIVTFSRQQPNERRVQLIRPLVEESARLLRSTLPTLVQLELQLTDEPLLVNADATQLQQVMLNLCTNAWHAMQGRAGRIVVGLESARREAADGAGPAGDCARLWVADDGVGMDAAMRARIFEPFFTTKPVGQGTGLGLSVVHGIVVAHGGGIEVASEPGRGSRFDVLLPLAPSPMVEEPPAGDPTQAVPGRGQHVLYVDDDPLMCAVVETILGRAGYRVTTLEDPAAALPVALSIGDPADLVVTDFNMPAMSGLDLARALRRARPTLPIVITSGHVPEGLPADARAIGVVYLLQKEFTLEQLVPLVQRALAEA